MVAVVQKTTVHTIKLALSFHMVCSQPQHCPRPPLRSSSCIAHRVCIDLERWCTRVRRYMQLAWAYGRGAIAGGFGIAVLDDFECVEKRA
jgi:hypothetical protein